MSTGSRLLLIGLKGSGKTSYLAALWHLVEAGEIPIALVGSQLQPDRHYLNEIRDSWLRFQEVGRTSLRSQEMISLRMHDSASGDAIDLSLPDLSGELFRLQWATRKATKFYADLAANATGALLFIHPGTIRRARRILRGDAAHSANCGTDQGDASSETAAREWTSESSPTDVQLVELLQFVDFLHSPTKRFRIAVVVSAWDLVPDPALPASWLERELPLLSQFLGANGETTPYRVYGVSAQGGDLQKDLERLQAETMPSRRIRVLENTVEVTRDLTAPIRYLLNICSKS
jgi:hypothetical protein